MCPRIEQFVNGRGVTDRDDLEMTSDVAKFAMILFLPFLLGKLLGLIRMLSQWREHFVPYGFRKKYPTLLGDIIYLLPMVILLAGSIVLLTDPWPHYFLKTVTPTDSPAYLIRNRFRDYVARESQRKAAFAEMIQARQKGISDPQDTASLERIHSRHHQLEAEHIRLEQLSMDLRGKENKRLYLLFGPEALGCSHCLGDNWMYIYLLTTSLGLQYVGAIFCICLSTSHPRKARWRVTAICVCLLVLAYEVAEIIANEAGTIAASPLIDDAIYRTRPEQLAYIRQFVGLFLSLLVLFVDWPLAADPVSRCLTSLVKTLDEAAVNLQYIRLAKLAILTDDTLRKRYFEYCRRFGAQAGSIFSDQQVIRNVPGKANPVVDVKDERLTEEVKETRRTRSTKDKNI